MKKITYQQALEIAKIDYNIGILSAIDKLREWGFDTSYYDNYMSEISENEFDDGDNITYRNLQYRMLGKYNEKMLWKAYDEVWDKI